MIFNTVAKMKLAKLTAGQIISTKGYYAAGDGGGASYLVAASQAVDGYGDHALAGGTVALLQASSGSFNILQFGASESASPSSNTASIQAAWDYSSLSGLKCLGANGVFTIASAGQIQSRNYGLIIDSNLNWDGQDMYGCVIRAADNSDMDVITTPRLTPAVNISLNGFTVDGNSANQTPNGANWTLGGMNMWPYGITDLHMDQVRSKDSGAFGYRIELCNNVTVGTLIVDHILDISSDGVHFKDSDNVVAGRLLISSPGDDGLIINANTRDVYGVSIGELVVENPNRGRGIYISNAEANLAGGVQRKVSGVSIPNAVLKGGGAFTGCYLAYGEFEDIDINFISEGASTGFTWTGGSSDGVGVTGYMKRCSIKGIIKDTTSSAVQMVIDGPASYVKYCDFDFNISNPADALPAASVTMVKSTLKITVDYDPDGTKVSQDKGVRAVPTDDFSDNVIHLTVDGAGTGLQLSAGHDNNTVNIGAMSNNVSYDIDLNGGNNNRLVGGNISSIRNVGTGNSVSGVGGLSAYDRADATTDGSGRLVVAHGLISTPRVVNSTYFGGNDFVAYPQAIDSTNITFIVRDFAGAAKASTAVKISWDASVF